MTAATLLKFRETPSALEPALGQEHFANRLGLSVHLEGLAKSFGARDVLKSLDLTIPRSQFIAVVGRSGCGKTTLLRLIAGLDPPSSGRILIDDQPVEGLQRAVRLLFQDSRLLQWETVVGNVGIAREPGWRETAMQALGDMGLADRARDWPSVLSGGQKQRVALARALVSRPGVLLLDEPFGALDALTRGEMHELLARVWEEHGFTTVLITHDVSEAVALADRVLVLREGHIVLDLDVDLPRPHRAVGDPTAGRLQAMILSKV